MRRAVGIALAAALVGCGGAEFGVDIFPDAGGSDPLVRIDAGDELAASADAGAGAAVEASAHPVMTSSPDAQDPAPDAAATPEASEPIDAYAAPPPHDAGGSTICNPSTCPVCAIASGYACCTGAGVCGCENPSQGGACL